MAKVPTYQSQVLPGRMPSVSVEGPSIRLGAEAFGGNDARVMQGIGGALGKALNLGSQIVAEIDEVEATNALVGAQDAMRGLLTEAYSAEGKNADGLHSKQAEALDSVRDKAMKGLKRERQRDLFESRFNTLRASHLNSVAGHQRQQLKAYADATYKASVVTNQENAVATIVENLARGETFEAAASAAEPFLAEIDNGMSKLYGARGEAWKVEARNARGAAMVAAADAIEDKIGPQQAALFLEKYGQDVDTALREDRLDRYQKSAEVERKNQELAAVQDEVSEAYVKKELYNQTAAEKWIRENYQTREKRAVAREQFARLQTAKRNDEAQEANTLAQSLQTMMDHGALKSYQDIPTDARLALERHPALKSEVLKSLNATAKGQATQYSANKKATLVFLYHLARDKFAQIPVAEATTGLLGDDLEAVSKLIAKAQEGPDAVDIKMTTGLAAAGLGGQVSDPDTAKVRARNVEDYIQAFYMVYDKLSPEQKANNVEVTNIHRQLSMLDSATGAPWYKRLVGLYGEKEEKVEQGVYVDLSSRDGVLGDVGKWQILRNKPVGPQGRQFTYPDGTTVPSKVLMGTDDDGATVFADFQGHVFVKDEPPAKTKKETPSPWRFVPVKELLFGTDRKIGGGQ